MCGIAGKLHFEPCRPVEQPEIEGMLAVMRHRGPDGLGVHLDGPLGLGHLRLSIIDLTTGSQPMANEDETVWIVFNGEIYNFHELRADLLARGHRFRTHSDTEVILHLYEEHGRECVKYLRGMFAFAIWDGRARRLFLARDRVGIKPLYYFANASLLAFASELKALLTLPDAPRELNEAAVDAFWCFNYLPGELTMFKGICKLLPGHWLEASANGRWTTGQYWDLNFAEPRPFPDLQAAADELSSLLRETIRLHMIADVPVGFLLSGGMDSSAVLSYAAAVTSKPISTFTVGFDGEGIVDERPYARLMAEKHGSRHFEASFSADDFWNYLPRLFWHLDEPVCEPPAVALHFISEVARQHVKVLLSGEGGDEAFGGYPNYPNQLTLDRLRRACGPLRHVVGNAVVALGRCLGCRRLAEYGRMLPLELPDYYWSRVGSPFLRDNTTSGYARGFKNHLNGYDPAGIVRGLYGQVAGRPLLDQMLYLDTKTWLPDDLLVKADKVTMASSLELRVPLLDHKVLEFAASLPTGFKVKGREIKRVLKAAFARVLPPEILNRKKAGFPVPYGRWLAGELWSPARDLLLCGSGFTSQVFERVALEGFLERHRQAGDFQREIFSLLALEFWHRQFFKLPELQKSITRLRKSLEGSSDPRSSNFTK